MAVFTATGLPVFCEQMRMELLRGEVTVLYPLTHTS